MDAPESPSSDPSARPAAQAARLQDRYESQAKPLLEQMAVNLRVWMPFLSNPFQRSTLVRFSSEDDRVGLTWNVVLPRQCWKCGQTTGLSPLEYEQTIRAFDNPVGLMAGSAAGVLIGLALVAFMPGAYTLFFLVLIVAIAAAITLLKSWREEVELTMFTCTDHAARSPKIDLAIDDQKLCAFLPTAELASATAADIQARRKQSAHRRPEGRDTAAPARYYEPPPLVEPAPSEAPIRISRPEPVDLPPIKLAGDDDEPAAGQESSDTKNL